MQERKPLYNGSLYIVHVRGGSHDHTRPHAPFVLLISGYHMPFYATFNNCIQEDYFSRWKWKSNNQVSKAIKAIAEEKRIMVSPRGNWMTDSKTPVDAAKADQECIWIPIPLSGVILTQGKEFTIRYLWYRTWSVWWSSRVSWVQYAKGASIKCVIRVMALSMLQGWRLAYQEWWWLHPQLWSLRVWWFIKSKQVCCPWGHACRMPLFQRYNVVVTWNTTLAIERVAPLYSPYADRATLP